MKVDLAIIHWQWVFGHMEHTTMICLSDHQTIPCQCIIPMPIATFTESAMCVML